MKITVDKSEFLNKLATVSKVASENKIRQVLGCVKVTSTGDKITLTATNLELTMTAEMYGKVIIEGSAVFKADRIMEYISTLDDGELTVELDKNIIKIYEAEFEVMDLNEYPTIKDYNYGYEPLQIESAKLLKCLNGCIAVSKSVTDDVAMGGVRIEMSDKIRCIASDSFRMVYFEQDVKSDKEIKVTIPNPAVFRLIDLLKNTEFVTIASSDDNITFETGDYKLTSRLITLAFPNWESVLKSFVYNKLLTVNRIEAIKILKRISIFARENLSAKNAVTFKTDNKILRVNAIGSTSKAKDKIETIREGEDITINLNSQFIIDYLNTLDCDAVEIKLSDNDKPIMISPCDKTDVWLLSMPLALRE